MPHRSADHPIILGIVGDSAAGKSTLSLGIAEILGPENVTIICTDDYHKYDRAQRAENGISALDPAGNYVDIMEQDLLNLRAGKAILKPVYCHHSGTFLAPEYIEPKPYIIVEGLLGYASKVMRRCYDVKLYLDPDEQLRYRWKIQRDTSKRGYTKEQVLEQLRKREYDSSAFIQPQRKYADLVVRFYPQGGDACESGAHLNVRQTLRPTLPHPDLTSLLDPTLNPGLSWELSRGPDNKPSDSLEIDGHISDEAAKFWENTLWDLMPEAGHMRQELLGRFILPTNGKGHSHPLELTQLLIAYHMVKAALGEHAI